MKKLYISLAFVLSVVAAAFGQLNFDPSISADYAPTTVVLPPNPLKYQVIFIGATDTVATTATYGNPAGQTLAKQWHDFIGVTPDPNNSNEYWIIVNHEMQQRNDRVGDGGGMTSFKVRRDANTDTLMVVNQTLADGRSGKFFNVDFVNTVGETGMNCGGIVSPTGRIWTAEEWGVSSNPSISSWARDTANFVIGVDGVDPNLPGFNGYSLKKYQNFNWMVEVDPKEAKAIRKQYNWGRQEYEGGAIADDNRTVYLGADRTPGLFTKFVADVAGDFTKGKTYVYAHTQNPKWIEIDNTNPAKMLNYTNEGIALGASVFNRLEWVSIDRTTGKVYMNETGRDDLGATSAWKNAINGTAKAAQHHTDRAAAKGLTPVSATYRDYYGRVLEYDPATETIVSYLEGGPDFSDTVVSQANYPAKHLSNPDGLNFLQANGKTFMIISEDLNGTTFGRMPNSASGVCELWLLDMDIPNPTVNDLVRISATPKGAEVTGAVMTPDGKTMLINSQHPNTGNSGIYKNSLTYAITGWDNLVTSISDPNFQGEAGFKVWPNPVSRQLNFETVTDAAIYDMNGKLIRVFRNTQVADLSGFTPGAYIVKNANGKAVKLIVE